MIIFGSLLDYLSYGQLFKYGVHIGHSIYNTWFMNSWLVYDIDHTIVIMDMHKFFYHFKSALLIVSAIVSAQNPIWFINLDSSYETYVKFSALRCGEFFVCSNWIHGMISNYISIFMSYRKLLFYSKIVYNRKQQYKMINFKFWILTRFSWPRAIFVSSVHNSYCALKEALNLGIPSIGIVDSNAFSQSVIIGIPGNDESGDCLVFYNDLVANIVLRKKFKLVILWYSNIRRSKRLINFNKINYLKKKPLTAFFAFMPNLFTLVTRGMQFLFSGDLLIPKITEKLFFYKAQSYVVDVNKIILYITNHIQYWFVHAFWSRMASGWRNMAFSRPLFAWKSIKPSRLFSPLRFKRAPHFFTGSFNFAWLRKLMLINRLWTYKGISTKQQSDQFSQFFEKDSLTWGIYNYFFFSEVLSISVVSSTVWNFMSETWSDFISNLGVLSTLSRVGNLPIISFFLHQKGALHPENFNKYGIKKSKKFFNRASLKSDLNTKEKIVLKFNYAWSKINQFLLQFSNKLVVKYLGIYQVRMSFFVGMIKFFDSNLPYYVQNDNIDWILGVNKKTNNNIYNLKIAKILKFNSVIGFKY